MIKGIMDAAAFTAILARTRIVEEILCGMDSLRLDHAFVDDGIARLERKQQMIAADPAVESRHAVERFRHAVDERRVAGRDFVDGNGALTRNARGFVVLAVGVHGAVVRAVVIQFRAA